MRISRRAALISRTTASVQFPFGEKWGVSASGVPKLRCSQRRKNTSVQAPVIDDHHAIAHNKVMVLDGRTLITGSFNFTHQAEADNAENLLVIKGHSDLISVYRKDFQTHKSHARPPESKAAPATHTAHSAPKVAA